MRNRQINFRLLFVSFVALASGVGLAYLAHAGQTQRHAHNLMAQALRAEAEEHFEEALRAYQRYLVFAPEDNAARARWGELIEQCAPSDRERWRAVEVYEQVLYREPSRRDIRRRLARLALRLGWMDEARTHLEVLLGEEPGQADLEGLLGQCEEAAGDFVRAAASYEKALRDDPKRVDLYVRLAFLLQHRLDRPENARRALDDMVSHNGGSAEAHLARAIQLLERGALTESARDLERARERTPTDSRVVLAEAELADRRGRPEDACPPLRQACAREPGNPALCLALAALEAKCGRAREAIACLQRGLQYLPDRPELLLLLVETQMEMGDEAEVDKTIRRLLRPGSQPCLAHYFEARLFMRRNRWTKAIQILQEVVESPDCTPALSARAGLVLALCHEQRGDEERQMEALRRAASADESFVPARLALAAALSNRGRMDEALQQYREIVRLAHAPAESWILLGRLLVQHNRALSPRKRRWKEVEHVLERAAHLPPLTVPRAVLQAEMLLEQERVGESQALLETTAAAHPEAMEPCLALADLALRQGEPARALSIVDRARRRLKPRSALYDAEITVALAQSPRRAMQTLQELEKDRERLLPEDRVRLRIQMAAAYFHLGETKEGRRLCRTLAERLPADVPALRTLLDLAVQGGDETLLAGVTTELRRVEGEEGTWWRHGEAMQRLLMLRPDDTNEREALRALVADLVRRRPDWPRTALLQAYLHERDGAAAAATNDYLRAFRGGERRPGLAERLVELLVDRGQFDEADEVVRHVRQQRLPSPKLARLGVEVALRRRSNERALELARLAVPKGTSAYPQLIWLGQVLTQAGRPDEGEEALRQAVRLRNDLAETWLALIAHLLKLQQLHEAEAVREEMRRTLPDEQVPLALAIVAEAMAKWDDAEQFYRRCLAATPNDAVVLQRAARFYVRLNRMEQAEPLLRRLLAPEANAAETSRTWAARQLALHLAFAGGDDNYRQALALLPDDERRANDDIVTHRARRLVQATRAADRSGLLRQVEESAKRQPFAPDELFYLVRLYERENDEDTAQERMLDLITLERNNPEYLAHHIESLLHRGRNEEARSWIARLRNLEPDSPRVRSFDARLRKR